MKGCDRVMIANKERIEAWIIQETISDPTPVQNMKVINENGLFYLEYETTLQTFNTQNRNKRIYPGKHMVPSLNAEHIQELEKKKSWCGEAGHPNSSEVQRLLTIDPDKISHKILSHTVNESICKGVIQTLCNDVGINKARLILQGLEPAYSLRALAPLSARPDGVNVVAGKAHVVTYDWVILPSHKEAYRDESSPIKAITKSMNDLGNRLVAESSITLASSVALESFIRDESVSVRTISNLCEVSTNCMNISKDLKSVILKENMNTYIVPIEDHIQSEIRSYMSNL